MADEIVLTGEWSEVVVAETETPPLADDVAKLAEERRLAERERVGSGAPPPSSGLIGIRPLPEQTQLLARKVPGARDWQIPMGPVYGEADAITTLTVEPDVIFRVDKLLATDTAEPAGTGTLIGNMLVGSRMQRPPVMTSADYKTTTLFSINSLGRGIKWDTAQPGVQISVTVSFIESCTFDLILFGKAVI